MGIPIAGKADAAFLLKSEHAPVNSRLFLAFVLIFFSFSLKAEDPWRDALAKMPLGVRKVRMQKLEPVEALFGAFRSNEVVRAVVFMPGATDQLYFFKDRDLKFEPKASLLDAVDALTAKGRIKATYQPPFLLMHANDETWAKSPGNLPLRDGTVVLANGVFVDRSWERLLPEIQKVITFPILPEAESRDAWHFYRVCFKAWGLSEHELIEVVALSTKTEPKIRGKELVFELRTTQDR
jgi:hypothetical protein